VLHPVLLLFSTGLLAASYAIAADSPAVHHSALHCSAQSNSWRLAFHLAH
jgi:hypothetical protein